jgi:hypothetical protein
VAFDHEDQRPLESGDVQAALQASDDGHVVSGAVRLELGKKPDAALRRGEWQLAARGPVTYCFEE